MNQIPEFRDALTFYLYIRGSVPVRYRYLMLSLSRGD